MLLALTGCKKNESTETNTFTASIETDDNGSKTSLTGNKVFWSTGDQITVYNHNSSHDYTLQGNGPTQLGTFTTTGGVQPTEANYWGFYPAGGCSNRNGDVFTFSMTSPTQTYNSTGFADGVNPMVGKNTDNNHPTRLYFKNAFSILKIKATGNNRPITSIELTTTGTNYLTGTYTYDYANGTTTYVSDGGNIITLTGISETLNTTEKAFHIVVPPHALEDGFTVTFKNNTSTVKSFTVSASDMGDYATQHLLNPNTIFEASVNVNVQVPQVTNLLPIVHTDHWSISYYTGYAPINNASAQTYDGNNVGTSIKFKTGTAEGWNEAFYTVRTAVHLEHNHTYYLRWCTNSTCNTALSMDSNHEALCYQHDANNNPINVFQWVQPIANETPGQSTVVRVNKVSQYYSQPTKCIETKSANTWQLNSACRQFTGPSGDYIFRIDVNNRRYQFENTMSCAMLIDLTADFAGTSIPSFQACDNKVYFSGTHDRDTW